MAFEPKRIEINEEMVAKPSKDVSGLFIGGNVEKPPIPGMKGEPWEPDLLKSNSNPPDKNWSEGGHTTSAPINHESYEEWAKERPGTPLYGKDSIMEYSKTAKVKKEFDLMKSVYYKPSPAPFRGAVCNGCNKTTDRGNMIYLGKNDYKNGHAYDFYCDECTKSGFPKAQHVDTLGIEQKPNHWSKTDQIYRMQKGEDEPGTGKMEKQGIILTPDGEYTTSFAPGIKFKDHSKEKKKEPTKAELKYDYGNYDDPQGADVGKMKKAVKKPFSTRDAVLHPERLSPEQAKKLKSLRSVMYPKKAETKPIMDTEIRKALKGVMGEIAKAIEEEMQKSPRTDEKRVKLTPSIQERAFIRNRGGLRKEEIEKGKHPKFDDYDPQNPPKGMKFENRAEKDRIAYQGFSKPKVNPAKEKAALRVRKAIILSEQELGKAYTPVDDVTLVKAYGSIEAIPDIVKSERMPQEFFTRALDRASLFADKPLEFVGKLWYGETVYNKGITDSGMLAGGLLGGGIGALAGNPLAGAAIGAGAGGVADKVVGKQKKSADTESSEKCIKCGNAMEKCSCKEVPWTKAEFEVLAKKFLDSGMAAGGLLGGGIGALAGNPIAGAAIGAGAGGVADKVLNPKPKPQGDTGEVSGSIENMKKGVVGQTAGAAIGEAIEPVGGGLVGGAIGSKLGKADPKMVKNKCVKLCKAIVEAENGTGDLSTLTTNQFNRAFIQASYDIGKAIAEPIDSKYSPKERKPDSDFGGESEISHNPTTADPSELASKSEKLVVNEFAKPMAGK